MKILILILFVALTWVHSDVRAQQNRNKPNIIVIMSDDHAIKAISAYKSELIHTPNIDRIANEGVLFNNAFVTNSLCGPSRATLLTGKYSHINGFKDNPDSFNGAQQTFPKILRANGYRTAIVGKWHLNSQPTGFDYHNVLPGQGNYYNPGFIKMGKDTVYKGYVTDITTDLALNWIESNQREPFLIMIHHKAPHRNQMPPLENLELFNDRTFSYPPTFFDDYKDRQPLKRQRISMHRDLDIDHDSKLDCADCNKKSGKWAPKSYNREVKRLSPDEKKVWDKAYQKEYEEFKRIGTQEELTKWQFQRYMEDYLRVVKSVDDNVGKVLDYLDKNGLSRNTIIIYTSDQGVFLGEHGLYDKRFMYEESFRTPMMIRYPKEIKAAQNLDHLVLNMDIAPTLLDFAGMNIPDDIQGESMKKMLEGRKEKNWRDKVYYHYYGKSFGLTAHYGVRTPRYKLIQFYDPIKSWELYDLKKDPNETSNKYADPKYVKIAEALKKDLIDLRSKYKEN